ncbi:MAG: flagellar basal body rod protein FlgB [Rhodobacteraceae bacterium]|nr:MAG: flagellar basal body rod protein FlgB [Paracoccaceae bacterium]
MFTDLNVFRTAAAMATHAGERQAVIAQNMANSDTPGYKARDLVPFQDVIKNSGTGAGMRASRAGHLNGMSSDGSAWETFTPNATSDPNGNTVSIENEMLNGVEVKRQHDLALAIYKSSLSILRNSLGR